MKTETNPQQASGTCPTTEGRGGCSSCLQECSMEAATQPIEYFEDEELDAYAHRPSAAYSDEEAEEFREVLYTMRPDEVADWCRSLTLRGIALPDQVKDEALLLMERQTRE